MVDRTKIKKVENDLRTGTTTYIVGALGLVAGLAWNDAVKSLIEHFFPIAKDGGLWMKFVYAVIITLVVVMLTKYVLQPDEPEKK